MPLIDDYSQDESQQGGGPSGGGGQRASGGGGVVQAAPSPQQEQSFVPWQRFVSANQDVSNREAGKLQQGVQSDVNNAVQERNQAAAKQHRDVSSNYNQGTTGGGRIPQPAGSSFGSPASFDSVGNTQSLNFQSNIGAAAKAKGAPTGGAAPTGQTLNPDALNTTIDNGQAQTQVGQLAGSKDLESSMGAPAWSKLLGDTTKAQGEANALGSEKGVQALLQQQASGPLAQGGAFDAALVSGAGGKGFQQTANQYKNNALEQGLVNANTDAQKNWDKLMGDANSAATARDNGINDATAAMNAKNAAGPSAPAAATTPGTGGGRPAEYGSYDDFMGGDVASQLHETALEMSPADAALIEAGRSGANVPTVGGYFRNGMGDPNTQDVKIAFNAVKGKWGEAAAKWIFDNAPPAFWAELKNAKNFGYAEYLMDQLLQNSGYKPTGRGTGTPTGAAGGGSAGTRHVN